MVNPARHHIRSAATAAAVAAIVAAGGCTINPATGERQLTLIGEQQEIALGRDAAKDVAASMGLYDDPDLVAYVQGVGARLAADSERPDLPWSFQVVDDPVVNAFALPGGYIYLTRGILTHFNSEAEMAAVLGHEIGHVTARHSVEQISQAQLATLGLGVATIASEDFQRYAGLASQGLQLLFLKFSRDDERQADSLGLRYMVRASYDPHQMVDVFDTLARVSRAAGGGRIPVWASTHPAPERRAETISERVQSLPPAEREGKVEHAAYLNHLEGVVFGEDPRQGYIVGNVFYHPELAIRLDFPTGWQINNQRQAVSATSPNRDAVVVLTLADEASPHAASQAFFETSGIEADGTGRNGLYYFHTTPTSQQPETLRGVAGFLSEGGHVYRLLGYTVDNRWNEVRVELERSLASFTKLTQRRYLNVKPKRVQVVTLPRAMTMAEIARRFTATVDADELAIVNGVEVGETLERGRLVKVVVGGELPTS
jgi:predicted Zn-dependent protease